MIPTNDRTAADQDAEGRRRRGRILFAIAVTVTSLGVAVRTVAERRADDRLDRLGEDLSSTFQGTTSDDVMELWYGQASETPPDILDELTTDGGVAPYVARNDFAQVSALYGFDTLGDSRCIRVTWTVDGVRFDDGPGRQCAALTLD